MKYYYTPEEWQQATKKLRKKTRKVKLLYSLLYGSQTILNNKPFAVCKAEEIRLKKNANFKLQKFTII